MFQDTSYEIEQDEELAIFALDYLTNMSSLITNTPERLVTLSNQLTIFNLIDLIKVEAV